MEIEKLSKERSRFQTKLDKNSIFQKYMERVQESTDEFGEIREIIGRHDTLVATHLVRPTVNYESIRFYNRHVFTKIPWDCFQKNIQCPQYACTRAQNRFTP